MYIYISNTYTHVQCISTSNLPHHLNLHIRLNKHCFIQDSPQSNYAPSPQQQIHRKLLLIRLQWRAGTDQQNIMGCMTCFNGFRGQLDVPTPTNVPLGGNPYISPIQWVFTGYNPQESLRGPPNCPLMDIAVSGQVTT